MSITINATNPSNGQALSNHRRKLAREDDAAVLIEEDASPERHERAGQVGDDVFLLPTSTRQITPLGSAVGVLVHDAKMPKGRPAYLEHDFALCSGHVLLELNARQAVDAPELAIPLLAPVHDSAA